jgi:hypothetical protein
MEQPIIATRTNDPHQKIKKIVRCLQGYPEGLTPKLIASKTGLNVNTVKSLLPEISYVKKIIRGLYKIVPEGDGTTSPTTLELTDWNFHNCILSIQKLDISPDVLDDWNFGLVKLSYVAKQGKATLRIASDYPLNVSSLSFVAGFFADLVSADWRKVMISSIEFNHDYSNLRLDGVNSISVDSLFEQFKVYQKSIGLRVEHKTKVPLAVESVVDMLRQQPQSLELNVKLQRQAEVIDKLVLMSDKNARLLLAVIDKLNKSLED